jgi:hypothetical protein
MIYLGTHVGGDIERISNFPVLCSHDGLLDELVVDPLLNINTRPGDANLSLEVKIQIPVYIWSVYLSVAQWNCLLSEAW